MLIQLNLDTIYFLTRTWRKENELTFNKTQKYISLQYLAA